MAFSNGDGGQGRALSEINVTPLVDVMLVLLIIFMIAAPMLTTGVNVDLPKADAPRMDIDQDHPLITVQRDQRIFLFDEEVSLGDFVLLGGEVAALAILEATARLLPGVLGNVDSAADESHADGLLEYPQYTRPDEFRGVRVPAVLKSGNHAAIARWRRKESLRRTLERRPDLLQNARLTEEDRRLLSEIETES